MAKRQTKRTAKVEGLPAPLKAEDLKGGGWKDGLPYDRMGELGLEGPSLTLYELEAGGRLGSQWVICCLLISAASGRSRASGSTDRHYGITLEGKPCRVGHGPHVKREIRVWINTRNVDRLMPLIELHKQGAVAAHQARDSISTKRLQGQLRHGGGRIW